MFAAALGISLMCQSLPGEAMHDIWNPAAGPVPVPGADVRRLVAGLRGIPAAAAGGALLSSFVLQTHLMYLAPSAVVLGVGLGGLVLGLVLVRSARAARPPTATATATAPPRCSPPRPPTSSVAVGAVAHGPPRRGGCGRGRWRRWWSCCASAGRRRSIDQLGESPGELHDDRPHGGAPRAHARQARPGGTRSCGRSGRGPGGCTSRPASGSESYDVAAHAELGADELGAGGARGAGGGAAAWRALRRRWDLCRGGPDRARAVRARWSSRWPTTPPRRLLAETLGYTLWWGSELGFWVWLVLFWALWLGPRRAREGAARPHVGRRAHARRVAWLERWLAGRGGWPAAGPRRPGRAGARGSGRCARRATGLARLRVPRGGRHGSGNGAGAARRERASTTRFGALDLGTQPMEPAIRFLLVRHGDRVMAPGSFPRLGTYYELQRPPLPVGRLPQRRNPRRGPHAPRLARGLPQPLGRGGLQRLGSPCKREP